MMKNSKYLHPTQEPDEKAREKMTFFNPFLAPVLEGAPKAQDKEHDITKVAILSAN